MVSINEIVEQATTTTPNLPDFDYYRVGSGVIGVRVPGEGGAIALHEAARAHGFHDMQMEDQGYAASRVAASLGVEPMYANRLVILGRSIRVWDIEEFWYGQRPQTDCDLTICSFTPLK